MAGTATGLALLLIAGMTSVNFGLSVLRMPDLLSWVNNTMLFVTVIVLLGYAAIVLGGKLAHDASEKEGGA